VRSAFFLFPAVLRARIASVDRPDSVRRVAECYHAVLVYVLELHLDSVTAACYHVVLFARRLIVTAICCF